MTRQVEGAVWRREWKCPNCGWIMSDLHRKHQWDIIPCPRCDAPGEQFIPVVYSTETMEVKQ